MSTEARGPTAHSELGGSKATRWRNCPGSVAMARDLPDTSSAYAREGSAAHILAERCLKSESNAAEEIGSRIPVVVEERPDGDHLVEMIEVTEDMAEHVQLYVDYCRSLEGVPFVEVQFDLAPFNPPEPMFGTADFVSWDPKKRVLEIVDLKYGEGIMVEVVDNDQVRMYALGSILEIRKRPEVIRTTIVQPRRWDHDDGRIRSADYTWDEIVAFKKELMADAQATQDPDAPLRVGRWCRFCPAKPVCPAQKEHAVALAQDEFDAFVEDPELLDDPRHLSPKQIGDILQGATFVEDWIKSLREYAHYLVQHGTDVPGWKLVKGRSGRRRWTNERSESRADNYLRRKGYRNADRYNRTLISPTQAEALLKKGGHDTEYLKRFYTKPEGRPKLAPADDPRPAVPRSAEADFADIPLLEAPNE